MALLGTPLGRIDDIVPLVAFLGFPAAQSTTAQTLLINGDMSPA
jgi:hypothetical protein